MKFAEFVKDRTKEVLERIQEENLPVDVQEDKDEDEQ